jgi:hypothetical protein
VSERSGAALLPVAESVDAGMPWLWWARTGGTQLAGMSAPPEGFPFSFLQDQGFDTIVSLAGPVSYDPSPLTSCVFTLQDLARDRMPADSAAEEAAVRQAVAGVSALLADGRHVAVHCRMGVGRTGLVIGAVLASQGCDPAAVTAWLDEIQRARGVRGWPESPWQASMLAAFGAASPPDFI